MSQTVRLRVNSAARDPERFPLEDEALGAAIFARLCALLEKGLPRPAYLVFREDRVEQVDALAVLRLPPPHSQRMLSAIAGQEGVLCVALAAPLTLRTGPSTGARCAVVFVEWPDNRWWTAWQPLSDDRELLGDEPAIRMATEGWPKPGGVGGWFAMARREALTLRIERHSDEGATVH
ncbi:MAG: hypothetical protein H6742_06255 [Alphaproteobacteria bacterium]|nr:hypothetical protein [Alphaproteobacteria bacterium]